MLILFSALYEWLFEIGAGSATWYMVGWWLTLLDVVLGWLSLQWEPYVERAGWEKWESCTALKGSLFLKLLQKIIQFDSIIFYLQYFTSFLTLSNHFFSFAVSWTWQGRWCTSKFCIWKKGKHFLAAVNFRNQQFWVCSFTLHPSCGQWSCRFCWRWIKRRRINKQKTIAMNYWSS